MSADKKKNAVKVNDDLEWQDLLARKTRERQEALERAAAGIEDEDEQEVLPKKKKKKSKESSKEEKDAAKSAKKDAPDKEPAEKKKREKDADADDEDAKSENVFDELEDVSDDDGGQDDGGKKKKKRSAFWIFYLILIMALVIGGAFIVFNVQKTMEEMRDNDQETIIRERLAHLSDSDIAALFESNTAYEDPSEAIANIRAYLNETPLTIRRADKNLYDVYRGDRKVFEARLNTIRSVSKLGLLNYDVVEFAGLEPVDGGELYHYEIVAPSSYEITVNGRSIGSPASSAPIDGFGDAASYVALPTINTYALDHLTREPEIVATDHLGRNVAFDMADAIDLTENYKSAHTYQTMEDADIDFDAMEFAKQWSLFMTDDLGGEQHGYYALAPYFIEGTSMQKKALQWATDIDITLTSFHTLEDPPFTNERVTNVVRYDDHTASFDVYMEKHMTLTRTEESKTDVFESTFYLIYVNAEWKVANIRGLGESGE